MIGALVGILLALATAAGGRLTGLDRSRAFYPCVLIAVATYDIVFAATTGALAAIIAEGVLAFAFIATAVIGFRYSPWIVAVGLAAHGVADLVHDAFAPASGIPPFWPAFCCAYDVVAALALAVQLRAPSMSRRFGRAAA